jgi:hypothetical protein
MRRNRSEGESAPMTLGQALTAQVRLMTHGGRVSTPTRRRTERFRFHVEPGSRGPRAWPGRDIGQRDQFAALMSDELLDGEAPDNPPPRSRSRNPRGRPAAIEETGDRASSTLGGSPSIASRALIPPAHARSPGTPPAWPESERPVRSHPQPARRGSSPRTSARARSADPPLSAFPRRGPEPCLPP